MILHKQLLLPRFPIIFHRNDKDLSRVVDTSLTTFSWPSALKNYFNELDTKQFKFLDNLVQQTTFTRPATLKYYLGQIVSVIINGCEITGVITGWTEKCTQKNNWIRANYGVDNLHTKKSLDTAEKPFYTVILEKEKVDKLCQADSKLAEGTKNSFHNLSSGKFGCRKSRTIRKCEKLEFLKQVRSNSSIV